MYLVDTSVWIDYFRNKNTAPVKKLISIADENIPFAITGLIYQEILQGASQEKDLLQLKEYLSTQRFIHPKNPITTYESAAILFYRARRKGITIRSTIDCLIAQLAIEHRLILLHHDNDYQRILSIAPNLKLWHES